jgi:hypothetical protein
MNEKTNLHLTYDVSVLYGNVASLLATDAGDATKTYVDATFATNVSTNLALTNYPTEASIGLMFYTGGPTDTSLFWRKTDGSLYWVTIALVS